MKKIIAIQKTEVEELERKHQISGTLLDEVYKLEKRKLFQKHQDGIQDLIAMVSEYVIHDMEKV
jgi:hypothetical protein